MRLDRKAFWWFEVLASCSVEMSWFIEWNASRYLRIGRCIRFRSRGASSWLPFSFRVSTLYWDSSLLQWSLQLLLPLRLLVLLQYCQRQPMKEWLNRVGSIEEMMLFGCRGGIRNASRAARIPWKWKSIGVLRRFSAAARTSSSPRNARDQLAWVLLILKWIRRTRAITASDSLVRAFESDGLSRFPL